MSTVATMRDCPQCGCEDVTEIGPRRRWWGNPIAQLGCNNCGHAFVATADYAPSGVEYPVIRCVHCSSADTFVASSPLPVRWHKCRSCGESFKSVAPRE